MKTPRRPTGLVGLSRQRQACACSRRRSLQRRSSPCRWPEADALRIGVSSSRRGHRGPRRDRERSRLLCATGGLAAAAAAEAARRDQRMAERFNGAGERLSACAPGGRHPSNTTTSGMGKQQPVQQAQLPGDLEKHGDGRMGDSTASESKGSRRSARQAFEDCPLIEIVHFHECLRGELRSLRTNVQTLCRQMRDLHHKTPSAVAAAPSPRQQHHHHHDGDQAATAPMTLELEGDDADRTEKTVPAAAAAAAAAVAAAPSTANDASTTTPGPMSPSSSAAAGPTAESLPAQHLELEVRVQSQFQLLWAVFQSHSTAEDEVIWPALKEKARSSGGKLKLVNHGDGSDTPTAAPPPPPPPPAAATAAAEDIPSNGTGAARNEGKTSKDEQQDDPSRVKGEATATDGARRAEQREVVAGGSGVEGGRGGGQDGDGGQFGEAMIDEAEYTEEHHEEQLLFEGMQEVLTGLRNTRHSSVTERLEVVNGLGKKADEMCRHLMTHLDKEEESALPLIKHYFTGPEMGALVGKIMGKRPTELMQTILSMMINNLPEEEVRTVMGYMKHAVKDTYFEKWLASGGFQWPTNSAPSNSNSSHSLKNSVTKMAGGGTVTKRIGGGGAAWAGAGGVVQGIGYAATGASTTSSSGVGGSCGHSPFHQAASRSSGALSADSSASGFAAMPAPTAAASAPGAEERRGGGGIKRQGGPLGEAAAGVGGGARGLDGCCSLDREFEGLSLRGGRRGRDSPPGSAASGAAAVDGGSRGCDSDRQQAMAAGGGRVSGAELSLGPGDGEERRDKSCSVCSYIGRCPVNEPLTQMEFESAVKRLAHVSDLSTERKSGLVQMMRNHMYQGRKRPRPASNTASSSSSSPSARPPFATGGAWPPPAGEGGAAGRPEVALVAPARYYTSTQPDIEDSGGAADGTSVLPPTLFTPEELAPTYHCGAPAGGGAPGDGADAKLGGEGGGPGGAEVAVLGCPHYRRACKIRAPCCQKLFTCRLCHDQVSDHKMDREEVTEMLCMRCETLQPINSECRNPSCRPAAAEGKPPCTGRKMARYYCGICHLFDDAPEKDIYHCPYCNVCRLGKGLGVDYYHCMTCNACVSMNAPSHTCLSKSLESDCPICNNSLFTSTSQVKGLRCGHFMHLACYKEYIGRAESREFWYRCPICRKSMEDMREYFSQMDAVVASQPMPEAYAGWKTKVLCHDCERYTEVPYHFYYLKCGACGSYNTRAEETMPRVGAAVGDLPRPTMLPPPPFSAPVPTSSEIDGQNAPPRP